MKKQVLAEGAIVAIVLVVVFVIIHMMMMQYDSEYAMSHAGMVVGVAAAGFLGHLVFEVTGANDKFVEMRNEASTTA